MITVEITDEHPTLKRIKTTGFKPHTKIKIDGIEFELTGHGCLKKDACLYLMCRGFSCKVVQCGYGYRYRWFVDGKHFYCSGQMILPFMLTGNKASGLGKVYMPKYIDEWPARDRQLLNRVLNRKKVTA